MGKGVISGLESSLPQILFADDLIPLCCQLAVSVQGKCPCVHGFNNGFQLYERELFMKCNKISSALLT